MNTNGEIKARSEAKAKEEQTTKLGLDVLAGQIATNEIETFYRNGSLSFVENPYNYLNQTWYPF